MITPRSGPGGASVNGVIYVTGGNNAAGSAVSTNEAFTSVQPIGVWTEQTPMPGASDTAVSSSLNGIVYVAGGYNGGQLSTLYSYNPVSNLWNTLAAMPGPRYQMDGLGVISNKLYAVGGWTTSPALPNNNLWVYDPVANTWDTSKASLPMLSADGAVGVISNKLYVTTPDNGNSGYYNFLDVYDPSANSWTALPSSPVAHAGPGYGVMGNKFYVAGGFNGSAVSGQLDVYDPVANTWTTKSPKPTAVQNPASAVVNGKLYLIGGSSTSGAALNTMEVYDPTKDTWTTEPPMITPRSGPGGASVNGVIYVIGGDNTSGSAVSTNEAFATLQMTLVSHNDPLLTQPLFLAGDGVNLFVTGVGTGNNQHVFLVPALGGGAITLYNALNPNEIALEGTNLFWIDPNAGPITDTEILRAPTNGSGSATAIYIGSNVGQPIVDGVGLASDGSLLYAADEVAGTVWRLNPDGSGLTQLGGSRYSTAEHLNTIAVNQGVLYIADSGQSGGTPQVISIATNDASFTTLASGAPLVKPTGIAVGDGMIYVSDPGASNTIWQVPLGGGTPTPLVSGAPFVSIYGLTFINGTLYVADSGGDAIYAISLPQPSISAQPASTTTSSGGSATLTVVVAGLAPFTYQWQLNGTNILAATNSSLIIPAFSAAYAGLYAVTISNAWGVVTSAEVSVAGVGVNMLASVIITGLPGLTYTVQSTPVFGGGNVWTTLTNVTLVTNPYLYVDYTSLTNSQRFYRVVPIP